MAKEEKKLHGVQMNSIIRAFTVLDVLKQYTDSNHKLSQAELLEAVKEEGGTCTEKTLRSDLNNLMAVLNPSEEEYADRPEEFRILYDGIGTYKYHMTGVSYIHKFTNQDIELLLELLKGNSNVSAEQKERIEKNLKSLGSRYYNYNADSIQSIPCFSTIDKTFLRRNLEVIHDAVSENCKIRFTFNRYDRDGNLAPVRKKSYLVNPYYVVIYGEKYYLLATVGKHKNVLIFRLDLMTNAEVVQEEKREKLFGVKELEHASARRFMDRHLNANYAEPITITLAVKEMGYNAVHDQFGKNYTVRKAGKEYDEVEVTASIDALLNWLFPYMDKIEIIRPKTARDRMRKKAQAILKQYKE